MVVDVITESYVVAIIGNAHTLFSTDIFYVSNIIKGIASPETSIHYKVMTLRKITKHHPRVDVTSYPGNSITIFQPMKIDQTRTDAT